MACPHLPQKLRPGAPECNPLLFFSPSYRILNKSLWPRGLHQPEPHPSTHWPWAHPSGSTAQLRQCCSEEGEEGGEKKAREGKNEASLQHDVTSAAFGSPNTERSKQHGLGFTVPGKACVLSRFRRPAPAGNGTAARETGPRSAPGGPHPTLGLAPPSKKKKKKMRGGNKDGLTHTYTHTQGASKSEH